MRLGIMQPYFFPYLAYWQLINTVDLYIVYDDVNYIKGGWINRNNLLQKDHAVLVTLPLEKASSFKKIDEISIKDPAAQLEKFKKTIKQFYTKAPYFKEIYSLIESITTNINTIADLNYRAIIEICNYLEIKTQIIRSSTLDQSDLEDRKGQDKVIYFCKKTHADTYVNAIGGQQLYDKQSFLQNKINLYFLQTNKEFAYKQFKNEFISDLSIIDILMFNSRDQAKALLKSYSLI